MRHFCAVIVINDKDRAKEISTALTEAFDNIGHSLVLARAACDESQLKDYTQRVGDLFYIITLPKPDFAGGSDLFSPLSCTKV